MKIISINHPTGRVNYRIFTKEEADKEKIKYVDWREAQIGQWALSDDGYVGQVIKRKTYTTKASLLKDFVRTPWGYTFLNKDKGGKFNAEGRKSNTTLSGKKDTEVRCNSPRMKLLAKVYAIMGSKRKSIESVYGTDLAKPQYFGIKTSMKTKYFKENVKKEHAELLSKHGFTEDYTMELLQETIEMAKGKKDVTNLMKAVDNLQDLHGMKEKDTQVDTKQIEVYRKKNLIDSIGATEEGLKLKEVSVKPLDE